VDRFGRSLGHPSTARVRPESSRGPLPQRRAPWLLAVEASRRPISGRTVRGGGVCDRGLPGGYHQIADALSPSSLAADSAWRIGAACGSALHCFIAAVSRTCRQVSRARAGLHQHVAFLSRLWYPGGPPDAFSSVKAVAWRRLGKLRTGVRRRLPVGDFGAPSAQALTSRPVRGRSGVSARDRLPTALPPTRGGERQRCSCRRTTPTQAMCSRIAELQPPSPP